MNDDFYLNANTAKILVKRNWVETKERLRPLMKFIYEEIRKEALKGNNSADIIFYDPCKNKYNYFRILEEDGYNVKHLLGNRLKVTFNQPGIYKTLFGEVSISWY